MTIIQPNKDLNKINSFISFAVMALVIAGVWSIFIYNQLVNTRYEISRQNNLLNQAEVTNAELAKDFYAATSIQNLESFVNNQSALVLDKQPTYIKKSGQ